MKDTFNWALVGTGGISNKFLVGLNATGGRAVAAVSRTQETAERFAAANGIAKAFADYDRMLADPDIDVVYIGTPHSTHKDYAIRALKAKKAVLCEKPCALNAGDLQKMLDAAKENKTFFMEALWTRYIPPICKVREWIAQGLIGEVTMIESNFGFKAQFDPLGRLFNPDLGGGALLDLGIYPLTMISMIFGGEKPQAISSRMVLGETGVDEQTQVLLSYSNSRMAYASTSLRHNMPTFLWIYGTKGKIHVPGFLWTHSAELFVDGSDKQEYIATGYVSNGYNYEAEEVMRCLRAGKLESETMPWAESLVIMETMDTIRSQSGFKYPGE